MPGTFSRAFAAIPAQGFDRHDHRELDDLLGWTFKNLLVYIDIPGSKDPRARYTRTIFNSKNGNTDLFKCPVWSWRRTWLNSLEGRYQRILATRKLRILLSPPKIFLDYLRSGNRFNGSPQPFLHPSPYETTFIS